jgi:hypothetical protein
MAGSIHPSLAHFNEPVEQRLWAQASDVQTFSRPFPVEEVTAGPMPYVLGSIFASVVVSFLMLSIGPDAMLINSPALCQMVAILGLVGFAGILVLASIAFIWRLVTRRMSEIPAFALSAFGTSFALMFLRLLA